MYSSEDLERFYFQYQTEAMPNGISIEQFCSRNKVPYNIFYKWYKDTRNKIVEVKVDGLPTSTHFTIFVVENQSITNGRASTYHRIKTRAFGTGIKLVPSP